MLAIILLLNAAINYYVIKSLTCSGVVLGIGAAVCLIGKDIIGIANPLGIMCGICFGVAGFFSGYAKLQAKNAKKQ